LGLELFWAVFICDLLKSAAMTSEKMDFGMMKGIHISPRVSLAFEITKALLAKPVIF